MIVQITYNDYYETVEKLNLPEGGLMIFGSIYDADVPLGNIEAICFVFEEFCFK